MSWIFFFDHPPTLPSKQRGCALHNFFHSLTRLLWKQYRPILFLQLIIWTSRPNASVLWSLKPIKKRNMSLNTEQNESSNAVVAHGVSTRCQHSKNILVAGLVVLTSLQKNMAMHQDPLNATSVTSYQSWSYKCVTSYQSKKGCSCHFLECFITEHSTLKPFLFNLFYKKALLL